MLSNKSHMCETALSEYTVKSVLSDHSKRRQFFFQTDYLLMQVKSIAECSQILSTFIKLDLCFVYF